MSANISAIYGAQLFQADDKPRYRRAFSVNIGLLAVALLLAAARFAHSRYSHWRKRTETVV